MINHKSEIGTVLNSLHSNLRQENWDAFIQDCDTAAQLAESAKLTSAKRLPQTNREWEEKMKQCFYTDRGIFV